MMRGSLILVLSLISVVPASASLGRKERPDLSRFLSSRPLLSVTPATGEDFRITAETEVLLDGQPCPYDRIPNGATIILLETATNLSKEIVKIHFRTPNRSPSSARPK